MGSMSENYSDLLRRLRDLEQAYPETVFGPVTDAEIKEHASLITRNSAAMARHMVKTFTKPAADLIESLTKRLAEQTEAKDAAIRLWNECGQSEIMLTAERDKYMALSKMRPAPIADLETLTADVAARDCVINALNAEVKSLTAERDQIARRCNELNDDANALRAENLELRRQLENLAQRS